MKKSKKPQMPDRVNAYEMKFKVPIRRIESLLVKIEPHVYDGFDGRELKVAVYVSDGEGRSDDAHFYRIIGADELRSRLSLLMCEAEKIIAEALGQFDVEAQVIEKEP